MGSNVFKEAVAKAAADDAAMCVAHAEEGLSREPTTRKARVLWLNLVATVRAEADEANDYLREAKLPFEISLLEEAGGRDGLGRENVGSITIAMECPTIGYTGRRKLIGLTDATVSVALRFTKQIEEFDSRLVQTIFGDLLEEARSKVNVASNGAGK